MLRIKQYLLSHWQVLVITATSVTSVIAMYMLRLANLVPVSKPESIFLQQYTGGSTTLTSLVTREPYYLPSRLLNLIFDRIRPLSIYGTRLSAVIIGLVIIVSFFVVVYTWFDTATAVMSTVLFLGSSWMLHTSRFGTAEITTLLYIPLIAFLSWQYIQKKQRIGWLWIMVPVGLILYIPGLPAFIVMMLIWQRKLVVKLVKKLSIRGRIIYGLTALLLIAPLLIASVYHPETILRLMGVPSQWKELTIRTIWQNIIHIPSGLFWKTTVDPMRHLGTLPYLDVFSIIMLIFGAVWYISRRHLYRSRIISVTLGYIVALVAIGSLPISALLPAIYLLIATGIYYFRMQWIGVFPKNPIARSIGAAILIITLGSVLNYHINRYFIAWPSSPATTQAEAKK